MLSINIICVGNLKESYLREAAVEYIKRLSRFCKLNIIEIPESTLIKEKQEILKYADGYIFSLCVEGTEMSSEFFAEKIEEISMNSSKISFIIGSSEGLDSQVKQTSDFKLSFSKFTYPHQLMRIILLEQIYRAFTINNNAKYHK